MEHQSHGIADLEQYPGAGLFGVAAGRGQEAACLHWRITTKPAAKPFTSGSANGCSTPDRASLREKSYQKEPDQDLRVWPDGNLPGDALNESDLVRSLVEKSQTQIRALEPKGQRSLKEFHRLMRPAWMHTLQVQLPEKGLSAEIGEARDIEGYAVTKLAIGRNGRGDRIPL
ncbi:MAG: hypothetical protein HY735_21175 [Verrucomicrobia bacterium]|nr:hypothetical protein [Verrucomicrobiota bacterium]